jgi:hypothetical protein
MYLQDIEIERVSNWLIWYLDRVLALHGDTPLMDGMWTGRDAVGLTVFCFPNIVPSSISP